MYRQIEFHPTLHVFVPAVLQLLKTFQLSRIKARVLLTLSCLLENGWASNKSTKATYGHIEPQHDQIEPSLTIKGHIELQLMILSLKQGILDAHLAILTFWASTQSLLALTWAL